MYSINQQQLKDLLLGTSALATGGGYEYEKKIASLSDVHEMRILETSDLKPNDLLCTIYAVGSTTVQDTPSDALLLQGVEAIEQRLRKELVAIFPGEIGAEHLALKTTHLLHKDILDADAAGGRAVPEIVQDQFMLFDLSTTPALLIDALGKMEWIDDLEPEALEARARTLARSTNNLVIVFDHLILGAQHHLLSTGNLKRALCIGELLRKKRVRALAQHGLLYVDVAQLIHVTTHDRGGFLDARVELENSAHRYSLFIRNENLVLLQDDRPVCTCPHFIILLDVHGMPIHNSHLHSHLHNQIHILIARATEAWDTKRGYQLFSPERFGLDVEVTFNL